MITLLNTSILTDHGNYRYTEITLDKAKGILLGSVNPMIGDPGRIEGWRSAIGHESTAQIMSALLGREIPVNRIQYKQKIGDRAIVFKLNGRPPEGKIFSTEEIEKIGYSWGLLERLYVPPAKESTEKVIVVDMASFGQTTMLAHTLNSLCMGQLSGYEIRFNGETGVFSLEDARVIKEGRITIPLDLWARLTDPRLRYVTHEDIKKELRLFFDKKN